MVKIIIVNNTKNYDLCIFGIQLAKLIKNDDTHVTYAMPFTTPGLNELISIMWEEPGIDLPVGYGNCLNKVLSMKPLNSGIDDYIYLESEEDIVNEINKQLKE